MLFGKPQIEGRREESGEENDCSSPVPGTGKETDSSPSAPLEYIEVVEDKHTVPRVVGREKPRCRASPIRIRGALAWLGFPTGDFNRVTYLSSFLTLVVNLFTGSVATACLVVAMSVQMLVSVLLSTCGCNSDCIDCCLRARLRNRVIAICMGNPWCKEGHCATASFKERKYHFHTACSLQDAGYWHTLVRHRTVLGEAAPRFSLDDYWCKRVEYNPDTDTDSLKDVKLENGAPQYRCMCARKGSRVRSDAQDKSRSPYDAAELSAVDQAIMLHQELGTELGLVSRFIARLFIAALVTYAQMGSLIVAVTTAKVAGATGDAQGLELVVLGTSVLTFFVAFYLTFAEGLSGNARDGGVSIVHAPYVAGLVCVVVVLASVGQLGYVTPKCDDKPEVFTRPLPNGMCFNVDHNTLAGGVYGVVDAFKEGLAKAEKRWTNPAAAFERLATLWPRRVPAQPRYGGPFVEAMNGLVETYGAEVLGALGPSKQPSIDWTAHFAAAAADCAGLCAWEVVVASLDTGAPPLLGAPEKLPDQALASRDAAVNEGLRQCAANIPEHLLSQVRGELPKSLRPTRGDLLFAAAATNQSLTNEVMKALTANATAPAPAAVPTPGETRSESTYSKTRGFLDPIFEFALFVVSGLVTLYGGARFILPHYSGASLLTN